MDDELTHRVRFAAMLALSTVVRAQTTTDIQQLIDRLGRRRVAFAFEDLTEKLDRTDEEIRPLLVVVEPTAQALPKLAPFLDDRDERVRCVTLEAMEQAGRSRHVSLASAAKGVLAGKKVNCSP